MEISSEKSKILVNTSAASMANIVMNQQNSGVKTIVLYGCETWTLKAATESKLQAFENKCMRKILQISYLEHKTNEYVWERINSFAGHQETIITIIQQLRAAR